jgi:hypothetical protein
VVDERRGTFADKIIEESTGPHAEMFDTAEAIRGKRARIEFVVDAFVGLIVAGRAHIPLNPTEPGLKRHPEMVARMDAVTQRGLRVLYGDQPTVDERATYYLISTLAQLAPQFPDLSDGELRTTLKRVSMRVARTTTAS